MARSARRLLYIEPELDEQMKVRADSLGLPVNEWLNRVIEHALVSKGQRLKYHTTTEVEI